MAGQKEAKEIGDWEVTVAFDRRRPSGKTKTLTYRNCSRPEAAAKAMRRVEADHLEKIERARERR